LLVPWDAVSKVRTDPEEGSWDPKLRGHDPRGPFTVNIQDAQHPVTAGLKDFETDDELYTCLTGDTPIHVLATAKSKVDRIDYPMAFVLEVGRGRVFHSPLGHDVKALQADFIDWSNFTQSNSQTSGQGFNSDWPENTLDDKRRFSQRFMAVIDRDTQSLATVPVREGLAHNGPLLALVAARDTGEDLAPVPPRTNFGPEEHFVLTFDELTRDPAFVDLMRRVLDQLEETYGNPMNLEFAVNIDWSETPAEDAGAPRPFYHLHILECRPLHRRESDSAIPDVTALRDKRRLFAMPTLLPSAAVANIEYLVFVDPDAYYSLPDGDERRQVAETVTALNDLLPAGRFGIAGPGRWGNLDSHHSVPVTYSDICNSKLLVEISPAYTPPPELAYGTDFYEDVVESGIVVAGIQPGQPGNEVDWELLRHAPNQLAAFVPSSAGLAGIVRVINLRDAAGSPLRLVIDSDTSEAVACFDLPG